MLDFKSRHLTRFGPRSSCFHDFTVGLYNIYFHYIFLLKARNKKAWPTKAWYIKAKIHSRNERARNITMPNHALVKPQYSRISSIKQNILAHFKHTCNFPSWFRTDYWLVDIEAQDQQFHNSQQAVVVVDIADLWECDVPNYGHVMARWKKVRLINLSLYQTYTYGIRCSNLFRILREEKDPSCHLSKCMYYLCTIKFFLNLFEFKSFKKTKKYK